METTKTTARRIVTPAMRPQPAPTGPKTEAPAAPTQDALNPTGMFSKAVLVTPEMAQDVLQHRNAAGRSISPERVRKWEGEMRNQRWGLSHQGVAFDGPDWSSSLIDGQHRMQAIVNIGEPQVMYVTFNAPKESFEWLDQQLPRTGAQTAAIELQRAGIETESPVSRLAMQARIILIHGLGEKRPSNQRISQYVRSNVDVLDRYAPLARNYTAGTAAAFSFAEISGFGGTQEAAVRLQEKIWQEPQETDPMRALSNALGSVPGQGDRAQRVRFNTALAALEYVDRGEGVQRLPKYEAMSKRVLSSIRAKAPANDIETAEVANG